MPVFECGLFLLCFATHHALSCCKPTVWETPTDDVLQAQTMRALRGLPWFFFCVCVFMHTEKYIVNTK